MSTATWGVVAAGEGLLTARLLGEESLYFECGQVVPEPSERLVAGLSATQMVFGALTLPFIKSEQIRAVLPQESADLLINRMDNPRFAFRALKDGKSSRVFFAVCESSILADWLDQLRGLSLKPLAVVVAELGAWPLLERSGLLNEEGSTLVVDASLDPPSIFHIEKGFLHTLRLVAPVTVKLGDYAVADELLWLLDSMRKSLIQAEDTPPCPIYLLGRSQSFWAPFLTIPGSRIVESNTLAQGLKGWAWIRSAGLALMASSGKEKGLDFQQGGGFYGHWREWLSIWRMAGILGLVLALVWGGGQGTRYYKAQKRYHHYKSETSALFYKTLPHIPVMVDARLQLRQVLNQAAPDSSLGQDMGPWIYQIQSKVSADTGVRWFRFRYEPGEVRLMGEVSSYKHLDRVLTTLKSIDGIREVKTEEAHIVKETKKVQFRLRLL